MGGDDSQKLLPWRGIHSSPGRKPPAQLRINNVTETAGWNLARGTPSFRPRPQLHTPPGSLLESRGGAILPPAEMPPTRARPPLHTKNVSPVWFAPDDLSFSQTVR